MFARSIDSIRRLVTRLAPSDQPTQLGLPRGFTPSAPMFKILKELHATSLSRSVGAALGDHVGVALAPIIIAFWLHNGFGLLLLTLPPLLLLGANRMRALENLVHEGGHYNFTRRHGLNDLVVDVLAALPMFSRVSRYRTSHLLHHSQLGTEQDSDWRRYRRLALEDLDRHSVPCLALSVMRRLPRYTVGWWTTIGTNLPVVALAITWHVTVFIVPLALFVGVGGALVAWALGWVLPFALILPAVRLLGEAGEHSYRDGDTILNATLSEVGLFVGLFHPHDDGYHLVHHLFPGIPHWRLREAHTLLAQDPDFAAHARGRSRLTQQPRKMEDRS